MKKIPSFLALVGMMLCLCACAEKDFADMTTCVTDDYCAIVWEDRTYVPYCAIEKSRCGQQIGIVDGDSEDRVYEFKGYSSSQWIINASGHDSAMLCREQAVTEIPEGLQSEYEWNP